MDAAQWPKFSEIGLINPTKESGDDIAFTNPLSSSHSKQGKCKKIVTRPPDKDEASLNCPRCNSTNTKFCYYNNYNPSQPRHLCKACRRYWTHGGTLRNVPVGGNTRKKNKSSFIAPSQLNNNTLSLNLNPTPTTCLPSNFLAQDLNMGQYYANAHHFLPITSPFELSASHGALIPYHVSMFSSQPYSEASTRLFQFQDNIKPTLDLCMDGGFGSTTHERSNMELGAGRRRITYPFGDKLEQGSTTSSAENISVQANGQVRDSGNGVLYWNNNHGLYN